MIENMVNLQNNPSVTANMALLLALGHNNFSKDKIENEEGIPQHNNR
jgi:hypothetical protein